VDVATDDSAHSAIFSLFDIRRSFFMKDLILNHCYTKEEVDSLIAEAIRKHNRTAAIISTVLGTAFLAAFCDGFFRAIGLIPPFMNIDVNIIQKVVEAAGLG